jgi:EamA-like transporter family.
LFCATIGEMTNQMLKTMVLMILAVTAGTVGDLLLAKGMKELGDLSTMNLRGIMEVALRAMTEWKIVVGTAMLALFFFLWLAVLSWEDLSVALPLQALNYVLVALLAKYLLHEQVSPLRWAGIALVCVGVMLITKSSTADKQKTPAEVAVTIRSQSETGG